MNLSPSQVFLLKALAKAGDRGLTKEEIEKKAGVSASVSSLGPVDRFGQLEMKYSDSLRAQGYVRVQAEDNGTHDIIRYYATAKGRKIAETTSARHRVSKDNLIPADVLDRAVLKVRPTKVYGLEDFTDADIKEIRDLTKNYDSVPLDDIRRQMVNRRKLGAYADPESRNKRAAKAAMSAFGPEGNVVRGLLTDDQIKKLKRIAS